MRKDYGLAQQTFLTCQLAHHSGMLIGQVAKGAVGSNCLR